MRQHDRRTVAAVYAAFAIVLCASPTRAGWEQGIVQVHATNARIPQVATCSDGAGGAIVVWQEETAEGVGVLFATHLLLDASLDPQWGEGIVVAAAETSRDHVSAVVDAHGGAYLWWIEGSSIFLTHIESSGVVTAGWPANGRRLGILVAATATPQAFSDGAGGLYIGWQGNTTSLSSMQKTLMHVGPDGLRTGSWRGTTLTLSEPVLRPNLPYGVAFAPAVDGGVWMAWARLLLDESETMVVSGEYRATHILANGTAARDWSFGGRGVGDWSIGEQRWEDEFGWRMRPVAIADGGDGGCYVLRHEFSPEVPGWGVSARVFRYASNGRLRVDWSMEGRLVSGGFNPRGSAQDSPQLVAQSDGSITSGGPYYASEGGHGFTVETTLEGGPKVREHRFDGWQPLVEILRDGRALMALSVPSGWRNTMTGDLAHVTAVLTAPDGRAVRFTEYQQDRFSGVWYGAAAITSLGSESALFVWSQEQGRHGVFANRLVLGQPVLDAGGPPAPLSPQTLRAAFTRLEGVRVRAKFGLAGSTRVRLFDVAGRQVAGSVAGEARVLDLVVPDSADLAAGLYFARATHGAESQVARVVIAR